MAERVLMNEYKSISKEAWTNIELVNDNIFEWSIALIVLNTDSLYHGGYLKAKMMFPKNYPYSPPDFKFLRPLYHPNIYPDGRLCISILHPPGEDEMSGESAAERWSPAQRVESVLISILSLLDDAEVSSPANVDAGVMLRKDPAAYKAKVAEDLEKSKQDIPEGFVMPTSDAWRSREKEMEEREKQFAMDDWGDSDAELDLDDDSDEDNAGDAEFDEDMDDDTSSAEDDEEDDDEEDKD